MIPFGPRRLPGPMRWAYLIICLAAIAVLLWKIKGMLAPYEQ